MKRDNIFYTEGLAFNDEHVETIHLSENGDVRIEKIVSRGQTTPEGYWYDQETDEYVILIKGSAKLDVNGEQVALNEGDTLFLPAHVRHRVEETTSNPPCIWVCVHYR